MVDIEIPQPQDRGKRYRFFEMLPGLISWTTLILPFVMSFINPLITVFIIITYLLIWFVKSIGVNIRVLQGWFTLQAHLKLDWPRMLAELEAGEVGDPAAKRPKWHYTNLQRLQVKAPVARPEELVHAIVLACYNESREVVEPTIQSVMASHYNMKQVILVIAYEERGGPDVEAQSNALAELYKDTFKHTMAVKHPKNIPGEVIGKGGNITYAGRELQKYLDAEQIDPAKVIVTTLDSDNRPDPSYLAALSYTYILSPDPVHTSYQPVPLYTQNIWDVPAPMRVLATGNSFWGLAVSLRPHMLRNFSSHAQSMKALIDTDFWSVRTIVEDGHQFWRTYFRYDGQHEVYPILIPIYQDAVLSTTYRRTLKAQFIQLRRWAWGASDVAYVVEKAFFSKNKVNKVDATFKVLRLLEGHVSWATAPLLLVGAAFVPLIFNPDSYAANQLPLIASRLQQIAMGGIMITMFLSLKALPPKPKRYKSHRTLFMVLQWVYLPITSIVYMSFSALNAQTRLLFKRYLDKFDLTEKVMVTDNKETITGHDTSE